MQGLASIEPVNIQERRNVVFHGDWRMPVNAQIHGIFRLKRSKSSETARSLIDKTYYNKISRRKHADFEFSNRYEFLTVVAEALSPSTVTVKLQCSKKAEYWISRMFTWLYTKIFYRLINTVPGFGPNGYP